MATSPLSANRPRAWLLASCVFAFLSSAMSGCGSSESGTRLGQREATELRSLASHAERGMSRYPVVLHHGLLGFDRILFFDYFYRVKATLERHGFVVYQTRVATANSIAYRTRQLKSQIDAILAETGSGKVNVIAHSMGGLDTRHLISTYGYGDRIASLSTISTPHHGSELADLAHHLTGKRGDQALEAFEILTGARQSFSSARELDLPAVIHDLRTKHMRERFNPANPDDSRVLYQSWTGKTSLLGLRGEDRVGFELQATYLILTAMAGDNDGLVPVRSARWGDYHGTLTADHVNTVGHVFGRTSRKYDHLDFYLKICLDLADRGL